MSALTAVRVIEVTTAAGCTHLVAEHDFATGCRTGRYRAVCDADVLTGSLATAGRELCGRCVRRAGG